MSIVVGFIPTSEGKAALQAAAAEAEERKRPLVVVNSNLGGDRWKTAQAERVEEELEKVKAKLESEGIEYKIRTLVRGNDPAEDILAVAEEVGATLIVIGLRRRSPVGKLLLGSNAQRILLDSDCPVLAVKAD